MRFHVQLDAAEDIASRLETTLDFSGRFAERFDLESVYFGANRRRAFLVVDLQEVGEVAELALLEELAELGIPWSRTCGRYPRLTAVGSAEEFGRLQAKVRLSVAGTGGESC